PLHGLPFTVKDWIETNDLPCAGGVEERRDYIPKHDATAVARLRAAGAILLGKTKPGLDDAVYPPSRNPFDLARTPGASSAGEAAIIAAGGSPLGLGSDSGGSLRWPAHCCGIATIKPTTGLVPLTGHFPRIIPMSDPRTVIGPMARTVDDLSLALRLITGPDGRDASVVPIPVGDPARVRVEDLRVAFYTAMPGAAPSDATVTAVTSACRALQSAGAVVEGAAPERLDESLPITQAYWARPESTEMNRWAPLRGSSLTADEVEESLFQWDRFRRSMLAFLGRYDLIVCPVASGPAPLRSESVTGETYRLMLPFSLTGNPVVVVRAGTEDGLPIGVQVVARNWEDATALAAASVIERACGPWAPP
ncbi:MAG: amidase, partial [Tepidiformaceae bacterium]